MRPGRQPQPLELQNQFSVLTPSPASSPAKSPQRADHEPPAAGAGPPARPGGGGGAARQRCERPAPAREDEQGCIDDLFVLNAAMGARGAGLAAKEILRPDEKLDLDEIVGLYGEDYDELLAASAAGPSRPCSAAPAASAC